MRHSFVLSSYKQLGDTVLQEPALSARANLDGHPVGWMGKAGFLPLIDLMGGRVVRISKPGPWIHADRVVCSEPGSRAGFRAFCIRSRRKEVLCQPHEPSGSWHHWGGMERRVFPHDGWYRAEWLFRAVVDETGHGFRPPQLEPPPETWRPAGFTRRDYVLLHVSSGWPGKCWPSSHWVEWIRRLGIPGRDMVVTAGPQAWEQQRAEEVRAGIPGTTAPGVMDLRGFLAVIASAREVWTVDGAASHLSSALGRRVMTLFSRYADPSHWHYSTPRSLCVDYKGDSMEGLTVDSVESAWRSWSASL
ncbi:MAG: glycosyltransferase family 9 protein [Candidatus Methylacidiphilales bacterium]